MQRGVQQSAHLERPIVPCFPGWVPIHNVRVAASDDHTICRGNGDAKHIDEKYCDFRGMNRVHSKVVAGNGRPGDGRAVHNRKERKGASRQVEARQSRGPQLGLPGILNVHRQEDGEHDNPGSCGECDDSLYAKDGEREGDACHDDRPRGDRQAVPYRSGQVLSSGNAGYHDPATVANNVKEGNDHTEPPTRIAGDGYLSQARLWAKRSTEPDGERAGDRSCDGDPDGSSQAESHIRANQAGTEAGNVLRTRIEK